MTSMVEDALTSSRLELPTRPAAEVVWWLCDLVTGLVLTELPIQADTLRVQVASEDTASLTLPVFDPRCPVDWNTMLAPGRTMLVLTIDNAPVQAWAVLEAQIGDVTVPITAITLETCLARTNVPELYATMDEGDQAAALCVPAVLSFGFYVLHAQTGKVSDASYDATEDRSILQALTDLMGAERGPEFMVDVAWNATQTGFDKRIHIGPRIGADRPDVVFDLDAAGRGNIISYQRTPSYMVGKGATVVTGVLDGGGSSRVMTDPQVSDLVAAGWPRWEERASFAIDANSTDDEDSQLMRRTRGRLTQRQGGTVTWQFVTDPAGAAPMPGRDFAEGDTVRIDIAPQGQRDPSGGSGSVRVAGYEMSWPSLQTTPLVWADPDDPNSAR